MAFCSTDRDRDCAPVPHEVVHVDHALKLDTTQCLTHGCALHANVSAVCGHGLPPKLLGCVTLRVRVLTPPPHDLEHVVLTPKLLTAQSTGQAWVLQARVSALWGHATPPCSTGCVTLRVRLWVPPPHDWVQVV